MLASDDYEPKVVDTVAFATVSLSIGGDPVENVAFKVEEDDIDLIIESLRAAKKDITALRRFIKI